MNKILLTGFVARDPQIFGTESKVARFSLACKRNFKNNKGEYETDFVPLIAYGKLAEFAEKYVKKGTSLEIEGSIRQNTYEKDGKTVYDINHVVESINFGAGNKKSENNTENKKEEKKEEYVQINEDEFGDLPWDE